MSPSRKEITICCESCIQLYSNSFQTVPDNYISDWRDGYRYGLKLIRWWVRLSTRDEYYYNLKIIKDFLRESLRERLESQYPKSLRRRSKHMENEHSEQFSAWLRYKSWIDLNAHVFIDRLTDHLPLAYLIYSSRVWNIGNHD